VEKKNLFLGIIIVLVFLNVLAWNAVLKDFQENVLKVSFFDVGQGDAIFVETLKGHQILIDGGPDLSVLEKLSSAMPFYDRTLDLIILTHPESDHMAGLIEVLKRYEVDYVLWTGVIRDTQEFSEWQKVLQEEGAEIKIAKSGQKITASNAIFDILNPKESLAGKELKNSNNTSIVAKLCFIEKCFLLTGDIYKSKEIELAKENNNLESDVLKVAHHGSKTSTAEEFVQKVSPEIAVIQVGENSYGHPHSETLETLEKYDINILRTDEKGDIKIISNGYNIQLNY